MDIAKAIKWIETKKSLDLRTEDGQAMRLALIALKEKQERESKVEQSQDYSFEVGV